jgi:Yip1 domain
MSEMPTMPAPPMAPPPAKANPFSRMVGAVVSPVDTFRSIAERPDWIVPLVVAILLGILSTVLIAPHIDIEASMRKQMAKKDMPAAQMDRVIEMSKKTQKYNPVIVGVIVPVIFFAISAIMLFAFRAFGGEGTFRQSMAVLAYAWVPSIIKGCLTLVVVLMGGTILQQDMANVLKSNPGAFLGEGASPALVSLLSSLDVFTIWMLVLMTIGYSYMSRLSRATSASIVFGLWLVTVLVAAGFHAAFG